MRFIFCYKQSLFCTIFNVKENFFRSDPDAKFSVHIFNKNIMQ